MKFNDWWNKEEVLGVPLQKIFKSCWEEGISYKDYVEDLETAFYAGNPKSSTDFTEVYQNPTKPVMVWDDNSRDWYIGYVDLDCLKFTVEGYEDQCDDHFNITHWLPMPDAPDT